VPPESLDARRVSDSMRPPIPFLAAALVPIVAAGVAGCGGGKEQVTAAELVQKGDRICTDQADRFNQVQSVPPASARAAKDQTGELVDAAESAHSDLANLDPPDAQQPTYDGYLDAHQAAIDEMKKGEDAAGNEDSAAYGAAQEAVAKSAPQRRRLASQLGFKVCSQSAKAP
jgi:hypothetical protein